MLHGILNKVHNSCALKSSEAPKTKVSYKENTNNERFIAECNGSTLVMLYSDMPHEAVQFECEAKDVVLITAVSDNKTAVWFS